MKSIEELYNEIIASDELKNELVEAAKSGKLEEFYKSHGCKATLDEIKAFMESKKELSAEEINSISGGKGDLIMSLCTLGIGCAVTATISAAGKGVGGDWTSQHYEDPSVLCNDYYYTW